MINQHQLTPLLTDFKVFLATQGLSKISIKNYLSDLYHFDQWFSSCYQEELSAQNTTAEKITAYLNIMNSDTILSLSTQKRKIATLRVFIHWLQKEKNLHLRDSVFKSEQEKRSKEVNFGKNLKIFNHWVMGITMVAVIFLGFVVFNMTIFAGAQTEATGLNAVNQDNRTCFYQNYEDFQQAYKFYKQQPNLGNNSKTVVFGFDSDTQRYYMMYGDKKVEGLRY